MRQWLFVAASMFAPLAAQAAPITYTYAGTSSGTLGNRSFTNATFSIVGVGDTTNVMSSQGIDRNDLSPVIVTIDTIGSAVFTGFNGIFYTDLGPGLEVNGNGVGLGRDFLSTEYSPDTTYDLRRNFGPARLTLAQSGGSAQTTAGLLNLSATGVTFTALVPEPSSLPILLVGIAFSIVAAGVGRKVAPPVAPHDL